MMTRGLTLTFFNGKIKFGLRGLTWEEFMALIEDLGAKLINAVT